MHQNFEDNEYVKFLGALSDLNQPYSCTQWGNAPDGGYSQIVHDTGSSIYSMLTPNNYVPATVWIDHKMRVHDQMNTAGSWSISSRINSMLEGCGECRIDGELIDDDGKFFKKGDYIKFEKGTKHSSHSKTGCTLLVILYAGTNELTS